MLFISILLPENVVRKVNVPAHTVVSLTFWDIPGREDMDIHKAYFRNLDAAIGEFSYIRHSLATQGILLQSRHSYR